MLSPNWYKNECHQVSISTTRSSDSHKVFMQDSDKCHTKHHCLVFLLMMINNNCNSQNSMSFEINFQ